MSKGNMLLGNASGKLGSLVFYRDGGEQRHRPRVTPKNPRSPQQMAQRVRIANVAALYRLLAPIVRDSFSNRPSNQSGYNAMASGAIELSPFMTKEMASADSVLPMPVVIAKGVLQGVEVNPNLSDGNLPAIEIPSLSGNDDATMGQVSVALLADYPSLQEGDKVTFVAVGFELDESFDFEFYRGSTYIKEILIDTTDSAPVSSIDGLAIKAGALIIDGVQSLAGGSNIRAVAAIVSRVDGNGALQTSFARLALPPAAQTIYENYRTVEAMQAAIASYRVGSESILR